MLKSVLDRAVLASVLTSTIVLPNFRRYMDFESPLPSSVRKTRFVLATRDLVAGLFVDARDDSESVLALRAWTYFRYEEW